MNGIPETHDQDAPLNELRRVLERLFAMVSPVAVPATAVTIDLRLPRADELHGSAQQYPAHPVA